MEKKLNRLSKETSPYLLQHSNNPVEWYPWGDEAFERAKKENKLVLVSIGYSSCHWCHVMEREVFSDPDSVEYMNANYINIKVDREEHPEVDQIYMNAVQIITRSGGWPLNCFALPNGKPVFGGTYFPKDSWIDVLKNLHNTWTNEPKRIVDVAEELSESIAGTELITTKNKTNDIYTLGLDEYVNKLKRLFDTHDGGIKGSPKFPMPGLLDFLLEYGLHYPDHEVLNFVYLTLEKIANGGIYDHLGGGFARYSVDDKWHVPHFEKMLYDNAQLISIYSRAYRANPINLYKDVVNESIQFLIANMASPQNGFYSAIDADSEGMEGTYYVWSKRELQKHLGEDSELFCAAFGVTEIGNFHGSNVLNRCVSDNQLADIFSLDYRYVKVLLDKSKEKLKKIRSERVLPQIDDKIIVSWNALLIHALSDAYLTFKNPEYLDIAIKCTDYIERIHFDNQHLKRISCKGVVKVEGLLDDYAHLANAYYSLYIASLDEHWLSKVEGLLKESINEFFHHTSGMFYYTNKNCKHLIARKMELTDGVISSSNSILAQVLFNVGNIIDNAEYIEMSKQMTLNITQHLHSGGPYLYGWAKSILNQKLPPANLTFNKSIKAKLISSVFSTTIYPSMFPVASAEKSNSTNNELTICVNRTCTKSSQDLDAIIQQINSIQIQS